MATTKAVIAAAGYGTRLLPITKTIEKCMMPLLNRPVIDYVVQDLIRAGVHEIYFVVSEESRQLQSYYGRNSQLETYLESVGKEALVPLVKPPEHVTLHYVVQKRSDKRYGTAIPAWLCREHLKSDEQFFFASGDQILWRPDGQSETALLEQSVLAAKAQAGLIGVEIPSETASSYGIVTMNDSGTLDKIVEKPLPPDTSTALMNASLYLLPGNILEYLDQYVRLGVEGEYLLTDVLNGYASAGQSIHVQRTTATYLDCGNVEAWVMANEFLLEYGQKHRL